MVIEVDGPIHNFKRGYDANRDLVMNQLGFIVLGLTNDEVSTQIDAVTDKVAAVVLNMEAIT